MKSYSTIHSGWRVGMYVCGVLALLSFAAALFVFVSDDFVIRGQVVSAADSRVVMWRVSLSLVAILSAASMWFFYRQSRR
jgi:ABC-type nickel/cobalt efflux system permease component RcnA